MIYSASRRTDLPAFYPDFICEKVRRSRKLEALVFWTKDPRHFYDHSGLRSVITRYPTIVQLTLTGLAGTVWEPMVPPPASMRTSLSFLAQVLPPGAVRWRFDPLIATDDVFVRLQNAQQLLTQSGLTLEDVTVSFPAPYRKVLLRLAAQGLTFPTIDFPARCRIIEQVRDLTGLPVGLCCQETLLAVAGTHPAACVSHTLFNRFYGTRFPGETAQGQRPECTCHTASDIGSYAQSCAHGCVYCYAAP